MVRARMGAGKSVWGGMVEFGTIEVVIQRPSGRDSVRSGRDSGGSSQSLATTGYSPSPSGRGLSSSSDLSATEYANAFLDVLLHSMKE